MLAVMKIIISCMAMGAAIGFILALPVGYSIGRTDFQDDAVKHHVAHYDSETSFWTWNQ